MKLIIFVLIPLILSLGITPVIPFSNADSTVPSAKSNSDTAFTAATFADKFKDMQFTGKKVSVIIKMSGGSENTDPAKRAKEIRYIQSYVLKFLSFSNAVNVVSNQQKNEITAQIDTAWIPILEQRSDVVSVTVLEDQKNAQEYLDKLSPKKQLSLGKNIIVIQCVGNFVLIQKYDSSPACVKPSSIETLIQRGWAIEKTSDSTHKKIDPLSSWNNGESKQKINEFVNKIIDKSLPSFVPVIDRVAVFDNDGTLWIEQPLYIPFKFHLEYLYEQLETNHDLAFQSPYSEVLAKEDSITNKDLEHIPGLTEILLPAYPDITQKEYLKKSQEFLDNTNHPRYNTALKNLTYAPMVELIHYLQQNNFEVYIVSAGFQGLMKAVSEEIYNIPKDNVIGTHPKFTSQLTEQGPVLIRQPVLDSFNDGAEKPVNIQKQIGKTPIFACGNSGGDIEMLLLTQNHENYFACMVDHDDENREYFYPNQEALSESQRNGWTVISMKNDFKTVFSNNPKDIEYGCSSDFWKNNLELWKKVGLDYNDDFNETFGKDYFDPNITLEQAINADGVGMNHLARSGTAAYLDALVDPEIDEETVRTAVYFGYVHQIDNYIKNCKNVEKFILLK